MARVTKATRSARIKLRVDVGPAFCATFIALDQPCMTNLTPEQKRAIEAWAHAYYRSWAETWVIPELVELLPWGKGA